MISSGRGSLFINEVFGEMLKLADVKVEVYDWGLVSEMISHWFISLSGILILQLLYCLERSFEFDFCKPEKRTDLKTSLIDIMFLENWGSKNYRNCYKLLFSLLTYFERIILSLVIILGHCRSSQSSLFLLNYYQKFWRANDDQNSRANLFHGEKSY